jgi:hypothetical protein
MPTRELFRHIVINSVLPDDNSSAMKGSIIAVLLLLAAASCEAERPDATAMYTGLNEAAPATLDELDWLAGYWTGDDAGTRMEEVWLPRRGEMMLGMHVDLFASGRSFFEYLRIEQRGDTLVLLASPRGRPPTAFIANSVTDSSVMFENPDHDFPQEINYRMEGGKLHAGIAGIQDGTRQTAEWVWSPSEFPNQKE